jgi:hypothetical protein
MPKDQPLWYRLYFHAPLYELARLVGYQGIPAPEGQEKVKELVEKYGLSTMKAAAAEIVTEDKTTNPPTVRLTEQARKLCWQLLGPPPEHADAFQGGAHAPAPLSTTEEPKPVLKKRFKKKGERDGPSSNVEPDA